MYRAVRFSSFGPAQIGYRTLTIRPFTMVVVVVMSLPYPSKRLERPVAEIRGHSTRGSFLRELRRRRQDASKGLLRCDTASTSNVMNCRRYYQRPGGKKI
jgi:hypothetical protein